MPEAIPNSITRTYKIDRDVARKVDAICIKLSRPGYPYTASHFVRDAIETHLKDLKKRKKLSKAAKTRNRSPERKRRVQSQKTKTVG